MFQGNPTSVSREFQWNFKKLNGWFQGYFKEFSRKLLFHESLEGVTIKIEDCFEGVLRVFHRSLRVFQRNFKGGSVKF